MKRAIKLSAFILGVVLFLVGCSEAEGSTNEKIEEEITLKFAQVVPENHPWFEHGDQVFIDKVEELSEGMITIEHYPDGQLGGASDMISLARNGTVDIVFAAPSYISGDMPLSTVLTLPQAIPDAEVGTLLSWDLISDKNSTIYETDFENNGLVPLYSGVFPLFQILTIEPFSSLDDLQGMRFRSAGGTQDLIAEAINTIPVQLDRSEVYQSLQRNTIDGGLFTLNTVISNKTHEVTNHFATNANLTAFLGAVEISENTWNNLPTEAQEILAEAGETAVKSLAEGMAKDEESSIVELEEVGLTSYSLDDNELQRLEELLAPVWDAWVEDFEGLGFDPQNAIEEYENAIEKYTE